MIGPLFALICYSTTLASCHYRDNLKDKAACDMELTYAKRLTSSARLRLCEPMTPRYPTRNLTE